MIDINKKYTTFNGNPARIICVDRKDPNYPVVALVLHPSGKETCENYTKEGHYISSSKNRFYNDLKEIVPVDWAKVPIDSVVEYNNQNYHLNYYSGLTETVHLFSDGKSSKTIGKIGHCIIVSVNDVKLIEIAP